MIAGHWADCLSQRHGWNSWMVWSGRGYDRRIRLMTWSWLDYSRRTYYFGSITKAWKAWSTIPWRYIRRKSRGQFIDARACRESIARTSDTRTGVLAMDGGIQSGAEAESTQARDRIFVCQVGSESTRVTPRTCKS
jgi:hypothetical protein